MMNFQTSVGLPVGLPPISHISPILLMGSCFAENMGTFLTCLLYTSDAADE